MTRTDAAWCSGQSVRARGPRWDAIGTPLWYRMVQVWGVGGGEGRGVWCRCGRVGDGRGRVACFGTRSDMGRAGY